MDTYGPSALWMALAAVASLAALFQTARILCERLSRTWTIRARSRRAVDGELRAEPLLRRAGYEVLARQVPGSWTIFADGQPQEVALRADLLVQRAGRRYVAEVKTGKVAPRLDHAATRRQLLEYSLAFGVDGVLLVDAEADRVLVVELGDRALRSGGGVSAWVLAFVLGAAAGGGVVLAVVLR